jgi:hypothetical protein
MNFLQEKKIWRPEWKKGKEGNFFKGKRLERERSWTIHQVRVLLDSDDAGDFISMDFPAGDDEEEESFCVTPAALVCPGGSCPCEGGKWRDIVHGTLEPRLKLHPYDDMAKRYKTLQERNRKKASKVPLVSKVLRGAKATPAVPVVPKITRGAKAPAPAVPVVPKVLPAPRVEVEKKAPLKVYPGRRKAPPPAPSKTPSVLLPVLPVALTRPLRNSPSRSLGSAPQPHYWSQIFPAPDDEEDAPADDDGDEDYVPDKDPLAF